MMPFLLAFIFLMPLSTATICDEDGFSCGSKFKGCICERTEYVGKPQNIVNCTNQGFLDASMLQYLPDKTQVLIFIGNYISDLSINIFGTTSDHSCLKVIDMSNNKIREIHGKAFHKVLNVERLILNHNDINIASAGITNHHPRVFSNFENLLELHLTNAFFDNSPDDLAKNLHDIFLNSGLNKLIKLHLEQNEIRKFNDSVLFCVLPNLMDLHLGDNELQHIDFKLDCLLKLRFLDLQRNHIVYLNKEELIELDIFPKRKQNLIIDLNGNPLTCGYQIEVFYSWLQNTSVEIRNKNKLKCKHDLNQQESILLDFYGSQCLLNHSTMPNFMIQDEHSFNTTVFLTLALILTIALLIYTNRSPIKKSTLPLLYSISQKFQYTTIGKNEAQEMEV